MLMPPCRCNALITGQVHSDSLSPTPTPPLASAARSPFGEGGVPLPTSRPRQHSDTVSASECAVSDDCHYARLSNCSEARVRELPFRTLPRGMTVHDVRFRSRSRTLSVASNDGVRHLIKCHPRGDAACFSIEVDMAS